MSAIRMERALLLTLVALLYGAAQAQAPRQDTTLPYDNSQTEDLAICLEKNLQLFCKILETAMKIPANSESVQAVFNYEAITTIFAPTDRGIRNRQKIIEANMGVPLASLLTDPIQAARFVESHIVMGKVLLFSDFRNGQKFDNCNHPPARLTIIEGVNPRLKGAAVQYFLQGPVNKVRVGFQVQWNIHGGKGAIHVIEDPIVPGTQYGY